MKANPYTLVFGKEPKQMISRMSQSIGIIDNFSRQKSTQQIYMITGVRESGKTVIMTETANRLRQGKEWIVAERNPDRDLLTGRATKLTSEEGLFAGSMRRCLPFDSHSNYRR